MKISVCIPSYNRVDFLYPLLDSIRGQSVAVDEVVVCEDLSPEREKITAAVKYYQGKYPTFPLVLFLNEVNLGYDGNFRELLEKSSGDYCLFMGNDDLLVPGAIERILNVVDSNPDVAVISRAYRWFAGDPRNIKDTVRHLNEDQYFLPGLDSIRFFYRRMGVLSGLVFKREMALELSTSKYDGHLYYQMYLAGSMLKSACGYYISAVQTLSRDEIQPDFGNSEVEKDKFKPGSFGYEGRIHMVKGLLDIARDLDRSDLSVFSAIQSDIGNYFYPYIRDQSGLPLKIYVRMVKEFSRAGMGYHPLFLVHCLLTFCLKQKGYDFIIKIVRRCLGRSPRIGI